MLVPRSLLLQTFARRYGLGCVRSDSRWNLRGDGASRERAAAVRTRGKLQTRAAGRCFSSRALGRAYLVVAHLNALRFLLNRTGVLSRLSISRRQPRLSKDPHVENTFTYGENESLRVSPSGRTVEHCLP